MSASKGIEDILFTAVSVFLIVLFSFAAYGDEAPVVGFSSEILSQNVSLSFASPTNELTAFPVSGQYVSPGEGIPNVQSDGATVSLQSEYATITPHPYGFPILDNVLCEWEWYATAIREQWTNNIELAGVGEPRITRLQKYLQAEYGMSFDYSVGYDVDQRPILYEFDSLGLPWALISVENAYGTSPGTWPSAPTRSTLSLVASDGSTWSLTHAIDYPPPEGGRTYIRNWLAGNYPFDWEGTLPIYVTVERESLPLAHDEYTSLPKRVWMSPDATELTRWGTDQDPSGAYWRYSQMIAYLSPLWGEARPATATYEVGYFSDSVAESQQKLTTLQISSNDSGYPYSRELQFTYTDRYLTSISDSNLLTLETATYTINYTTLSGRPRQYVSSILRQNPGEGEPSVLGQTTYDESNQRDIDISSLYRFYFYEPMWPRFPAMAVDHGGAHHLFLRNTDGQPYGNITFVHYDGSGPLLNLYLYGPDGNLYGVLILNMFWDHTVAGASQLRALYLFYNQENGVPLTALKTDPAGESTFLHFQCNYVNYPFFTLNTKTGGDDEHYIDNNSYPAQCSSAAEFVYSATARKTRHGFLKTYDSAAPPNAWPRGYRPFVERHVKYLVGRNDELLPLFLGHSIPISTGCHLWQVYE